MFSGPAVLDSSEWSGDADMLMDDWRREWVPYPHAAVRVTGGHTIIQVRSRPSPHSVRVSRFRSYCRLALLVPPS